MRQKFNRLIVGVLVVFGLTNSYASDTLFVNTIKSEIGVYDHISIFKDSGNKLTIDSLLKNPGKYEFNDIHNAKGLNFGFSTATYWVKLIIRNISDIPANYVFEVSNPDLDHISFYQVIDNVVTKRVETGELHDDRNYLSNLNLKPGVTYVCYISANNLGHPFFIPLRLKEETFFAKTLKKSELLFWLINGLFVFIIIFNFYLYRITKDKVNLYYSLYVVFAALTLLSYDGYFYFFNPPVFLEKIKWLNPSLYVVFLLSFTQVFTSYNTGFKWQKKILNPVKILALIAVIFYSLQYPFSLVADFGIPLLILASLILIIVISARALKRDYSPSVLLLIAYSSVFIGFLINQLKELDIISSSFFVENTSKFGQTLECIILTIAVLERFRINQKNDKQTISNNLKRIELQNKELEIINTELEKLALVASETDNSIASYDNNGRLEWCNAGFEKLYEVHINDLIKSKRDNIELIIPNENICLYVNKCHETKLPVVFETPVLTKSNKELWVQTTLSPFIRSGKIRKIIAIDSDITGLKTYERELETAKVKAEESDRLKTAFLNNISHEIRTPMNSIVGFSAFLNQPDLDPFKRKQFTDIIVQSSNQLLSIINDIISIASIEAGQEETAENQFDLNSTLVSIHQQFLLKANKHSIGISLKPYTQHSDEKIIADESKLVKVLTNLIDNALKFTKKGSVNFGYTIKNNELEFFVEDTGIGIASEMHKEIFIRFRQVESTIAREFGGSGLGLSISKAYVELLGGKIWLVSELDKGSIFYFTIPLKRADKNILSEEKSANILGITVKEEPKTILVAEDEDSNYMLVEAMLSGLNINIIRVVDGAEAVDTCKSKLIDMVLMDIQMPLMDGYEATRQIREFMPDLPIIAQTAYSTEPDKSKALLCGCTDFIAKPLKHELLISMINKQLFKPEVLTSNL
jgi:signal transduction histidine kinase/ActR/RegA family two-component response regulator